MESVLSPDDENNIPPVPIKTYQWEDLRRAREAGGYPWTHLLKVPLKGEITAEDIQRESTPRRSMSREFTRSRTRSPVDGEVQKILNLDSSPGSSRRHGEEGEDEGVHIPNFSKEVSLEEDDAKIQNMNEYPIKRPESQSSSHLATPVEIPKNVSPKSILKRRLPEQQYNIGVSETREKTKCCHPLVNKIKYLADKTLHKLDRTENDKSSLSNLKKNDVDQEIRQLKSSPSAVRRQKFSAIKLGDSDEMSKTMSVDTPPPRKKKEHIYEDIEDSKSQDHEKPLNFSHDIDQQVRTFDYESQSDSNTENEKLSNIEKKSIASQDPSLVTEDTALKTEDHVMEILHKDVKREALFLDEEMDINEPSVDEIFQNQLSERGPNNGSPNITITEITEDDPAALENQFCATPIESSPSPSHQERGKRSDAELADSQWSKPSSMLRRWTSEGGTPLEKPVRPTREGSVQQFTPDVRCGCQFFQSYSLLPERVNPIGTRPTSRASNFILNGSDHEYEVIEKPRTNILYTAPSVEEKARMVKTDDELSSTTSLERKYLQHTSDEEEAADDKELGNNDAIINAEILQKNIEDRFFIDTPTTSSRIECDVSTSQVDSSALENLPLKRDCRLKNGEGTDKKYQQRFREGTNKIKTQAGKLKTKLQNIKTSKFTMPDRPKINFPDRPKFKMPERPKISMPDRPKFTLPGRRKFSLPDRPKFKKINISEKLSLGDRKKFTLPERPRFNVPEMPKFRMPERPKINFPSLARRKENKVETDTAGLTTELENVATVEFETKTYPRWFSKKKKSEIPKVSSSPTLNREDTPPPTFTFTRVNKTSERTQQSSYNPDSPEQPREYGDLSNENISYVGCSNTEGKRRYDTTYDFDKLASEYMDEECEPTNFDNNHTSSIPDLSPCKQEHTTVITEINNDEFFVRPRGISREDIQVREYLNDETIQAFKTPKNILALMGSSSEINDDQISMNDLEADPELIDDIDGVRYSTEDLNDKDDGYYTYPPVRPSRAKRKKKQLEYEAELELTQYIDDSADPSTQFTEVDLGLHEDQFHDHQLHENIFHNHIEPDEIVNDDSHLQFSPVTDLHSIHEYANDDVIQYPENVPIESQTLPMPPKRKRKFGKIDLKHSSLSDLKKVPVEELWEQPLQHDHADDIIVYRTEHEYIVPRGKSVADQSPVAPRRTRSRSSCATSLCDDDRTSHGAESLTLDTFLPHAVDIHKERDIRHESPGYATVDKGPSAPSKGIRRSISKTPPVRRRKSHSSERKYYTIGSTKNVLPDRPPRKKSSTSLMTLDSFTKHSDVTQYVEIDEPFEELHKDLQSGDVVNKMRDRPLPPPPRPPRGSRKKKKSKGNEDGSITSQTETQMEVSHTYLQDRQPDDLVEIEVSTQTDPLPDDVDFELGYDENLDMSMSSSLRDIIDEDSILAKSYSRLADSPRVSRPASRSEKSVKLSDPKISELSKPNIGRTSPTVILVEKRVSSPTRINERQEMVTEASLTVQPIDIDESQIPDVPPLPKARRISSTTQSSKNTAPSIEERALERLSDASREIQLDNLITQRLHVTDLDVGRLNVSELQANKILVSDIEGTTLQVSELDSKSGHISVSGIEFSQSVIDEIVKKFAEISTSHIRTQENLTVPDCSRPVSREEETQTEQSEPVEKDIDVKEESKPTTMEEACASPSPPPRPTSRAEDGGAVPQRPPPPDLTPLLYSYLQDMAIPPATFYRPRGDGSRVPFPEFHEPQPSAPLPSTRRVKRKPATPHLESSSDEARVRPSPRRVPPPVRAHEPTIAEAGAQFLRVCHSSISRTLRNMFSLFMSYLNGTEDKKGAQMALVIFLVLIAGLIMFGLSDSRAVHHHHWEFFNPPDGKQ
ncbi:putative titin [Operophtera brumata]|uniref:Putative titin n=1 Tax=Operophtera brumata TaxID=104452 RepID=A0A0L7L932_OPEBR|nr:putative titin [Operophtera brumata]